MTHFEFESYQNIMRAVAIRQDIKDLILDATDRLLNQFGNSRFDSGWLDKTKLTESFNRKQKTREKTSSESETKTK
jgi:hypothetical protein